MRARVISSTATFDPDTYEMDDKYRPDPNPSAMSVHTLPDLIRLMESDPSIEIDARVIAVNQRGERGIRKLERTQFLEAIKRNAASNLSRLRESDPFLTDSGYGGSLVGDDYIPLLGGPFYKQLYIYDYLKMHNTAFHAYNHDPIARCIVNLKRDFTLGRGWQVTCKDPMAMALWQAFEEANNLYEMMDMAAKELEIYGETMIWELPDGETKIGYDLRPGQSVPRGLIPRVRLIDPSVIWEVVTYPEDITRVLFYQWVAPTQYQIYSGSDQGQSVGTSKFIYQQIPAEQVDHWKINCVSNEKRGRSGLFPVLGYLKRLRDTVNYSVIAMQKAAAWAIDTEIDGSDEDIQAYVDSQNALGTIAPAGSEFVHSSKVKRNYISNSAAKGGSTTSFDWCLSMIASGTGVPISYLNTHLSGGQTRASALVATEPVTKMFEKRQLLYEQMLQKMAKRLFKRFGLDAHIEVTFPELVTQDRSAKLKDLAMAQAQGWISKRRAAEIAAQELQITEYNWTKEEQAIKQEEEQAPQMIAPLSTPPAVPTAKAAISGEERADLEAMQ
jgi:hypothetical protein